MEIKEFRKIISSIGKDKTEFEEISKAVLDTLAPWGRWYSLISKDTQQNILNSLMENDISNMITNHLPEKFDFDKLHFSREVIRKIKENWTQLY